MLSIIPKKTKNHLNLFDELFNDFYNFDRSYIAERNLATPLNVEADEKNVYITAELAGMNKDDINIEYKDGLLTISGEKKEEKEEKEKGCYCSEISYGKFSRSVNVGDINFEKSKADFKNGVLKIELPKAEQAKAQKLLIK